MKILINTTPPTNTGGVANQYEALKGKWTKEVEYNYIGGRKGIPGSVIIIFDLLQFIYKCITLKPDIVLLNPSLGRTALMRDGLFLRVSKFLAVKTIIFFQGWHEVEEKKIDERPEKFVKIFNRADFFLVQASAFCHKMREWGITKPIGLAPTNVDESLIRQLDLAAKNYGKRLLFLARIEPDKGIFIALKAFDELQKKFPDVKLVVAGTGSALPKAKQWVKKNKLGNVQFKGYLRGDELQKVFKLSDLYIFPTSHGEGTPSSVLEAMAVGLPVITRPVGGIVDFFENGKMGYMIDTLEPAEFAEKAALILDDPKKLKTMSKYNHQYAKENFMASKVANRLEGVFENLADEK